MRLRSLCAALMASAALVVPTAVTTGAQAAAPPILFGLIDHHLSDVQRDSSQLGLTPGIISTFYGWGPNSGATPTNMFNWMNRVRALGAAPSVDLMPPATATLYQIAHGKQDTAMRPWIHAMKSFGHPVLVRLFPEMNAKWETYSPGTRGQTSAQFVTAFRHVYQYVHYLGATNVKIVWNPNRTYSGETPYKALWPGWRYVDWVAVDGYNWADRSKVNELPYNLLAPSVNAIRALTATKPLMIAELGTAPAGAKPDWISRSTSAMQRLGAKALVWFNERPGNMPNWRLDSAPMSSAGSSLSLAAARRAFQASNVTFAKRTSLASIDHMVLTGSY
jgi:hypothetical protein